MFVIDGVQDTEEPALGSSTAGALEAGSDDDAAAAAAAGDDRRLSSSSAGMATVPSSPPPSWPRSLEQSMRLYSLGSFGVQRSPSRKSREAAQLINQESGLSAAGDEAQLASQRGDMDQFPPKGSVREASAWDLVAAGESGAKEEALDASYRAPSLALQDSIPLLDEVDASEVKGSSWKAATLNATNVLVGMAVLSTPYAVSHGGWLSLPLLFIFAIVFFNTAILLKHCLESRDGLKTYPDVGEAAFGQTGRWLIAVLLYIELYSITVELLILEGDNLAQLFPNASVDLGWTVLPPEQVMLVLAGVCVLPTVWLRDLSFLAYFSIMGIVASVLVVLAVAWVGAVEGVGFHEGGDALVRFGGWPVAIGMYSFCFSGHTVMPNIYWSMNDRSQFTLVLVISFAIAAVLYGGMALMGYLEYGDAIKSQITLNLPSHSIVGVGAVWTTVLNPLTKIALMVTPLALGIEELLPWGPDDKATHAWGTLVRTFLILSAIIVAWAVPFFGFVMALIGSFLGMTMSVVLPCACYLKLVGHKSPKWQRSLSWLYLVLGIIAAGLGTYSSVNGILDSWRGPSAPAPAADGHRPMVLSS